MKATTSLRKFMGLNTYDNPIEIEDSELAEATNVTFDRSGSIKSRGRLRQVVALRGNYGPTSIEEFQGNIHFLGRFQYIGSNQADRFFFTLGDGLPVASMGGIEGTKWVDSDSLLWSSTIYDLWAEESGVGILDPTLRQCTVTHGIYYNDELFLSDGYKIGSTGTVTQFNSDVPQIFVVGSMCLHKDRMFTCKKHSTSYDSRLFWSNAGDPEITAADSFADIGAGDGGVVTQLVSYKDNLFIFKTTSVWVLYTSGTPSNWVLRKVSEVGAFGHTPIEHEGYIYWAGSEGVFAWDGNGTSKISGPIQDVFDAGNLIDGDYDETSVAVSGTFHTLPSGIYKDNYIFMLLDSDGNRTLYNYNIKSKAWSTIWFEDLDRLQDIFTVEDTVGMFESGVYLCLKSEEFKQAAVYKLEIDGIYDTRFIVAIGVAAPVTTTSFAVEEDLSLLTESIAGYTFEMIDGSGATPGETAVIESFTDTSITFVAPGFSEAPNTNCRGVVYKKETFDVTLKTKVFDSLNAASIKRLKALGIEGIFHNLTVMQEEVVDEGVTNANVETTIQGRGTRNSYLIPGLGRLRNIQITLSGISNVLGSLTLFAIDFYSSDKGKVATSPENADNALNPTE